MEYSDVNWLIIVFSIFINLAVGYFWLNPRISNLGRESTENNFHWFRRTKGPYLVLALFLFLIAKVVYIDHFGFLNSNDVKLFQLVLIIVVTTNVLTAHIMGIWENKESGLLLLMFLMISTLIIIRVGLIFLN
jgi:hypothetical protein